MEADRAVGEVIEVVAIGGDKASAQPRRVAEQAHRKLAPCRARPIGEGGEAVARLTRDTRGGESGAPATLSG